MALSRIVVAKGAAVSSGSFLLFGIVTGLLQTRYLERFQPFFLQGFSTIGDSKTAALVGRPAKSYHRSGEIVIR
jgi:hypothetical protein